MYDYKALEKKLRLVVSYVAPRLKEEDLQEINELIDHHAEYGVAYEMLCHLIAQEQIVITPEVYELITELGKQMNFGEDVWNKLAPLKREASG